MAWTCPECDRIFARNKQAHSCKSYDLNPLFINKSKGVRDLYDYLFRVVNDFGDVDVRVTQFNVNFRNLSTFMTIIPERNHLTITFIRNEKLEEFPIYQSYQRSKKRWSNLVKVESKDEIDKQLISWLKDAYETTG